MDQADPVPSIDDAFAGSSFTARGIYERLVDAMRPFGPMAEEAGKGAVATTAGGTAFANAVPRGDSLLLLIRSDVAIANGRIRRIGKGDDGLFRNDLVLASVNEVDDELLGLLRRAYENIVRTRSG